MSSYTSLKKLLPLLTFGQSNNLLKELMNFVCYVFDHENTKGRD